MKSGRPYSIEGEASWEMFTVSTGPVLLILAVALLLPAKIRVYILGAVLCLGDATVLGAPVAMPAAWLALILLVMRDAAPRPSALAYGCAAYPGAMLLALIGYDVFAIFLAGAVFAGHLTAMPNTAFFKVGLAQPVQIVPAHLNQFIYLALGVCAALMIAARFQGRRIEEAQALLGRALTGFVLAGGLVALWQWLSFSLPALPYPSDILHSGAKTLAFDQAIAGVRRVSGPFSEPSSLGTQLGPAVCCLLAFSPFAKGAVLRGVAIALGLVALILSTSTTAFAVLPLTVLCCVGAAGVRVFLGFRAGLSTYGRSRLFGEVLVIATMLMCAAGVVVVLAAEPHTRDIVYATLLNKGRTSSFAERGAANGMALSLMVSTFGLGVGLGGHVASNAWLTVGAGLGVFGLVVFALVLGEAAAPVGLSIRPGGGVTPPAVHFRLLLAALVLGLVFTNSLSGANINQPLLWLVMGFASLRRRAPNRRAWTRRTLATGLSKPAKAERDALWA